MSVQSISVLVAGMAVVVGACFQYLTIRMTRKNVLSNLRADVAEGFAAGLRDALARYSHVSYEMDLKWRAFKQRNEPLDQDYYERAEEEDRLYNLIRLYLDPEDPDHQTLFKALEHLRDPDSDELWIERRDKLVATAVRVFSLERAKILEGLGASSRTRSGLNRAREPRSRPR